MASSSKSWWQNRKERPNGSINNGDMIDKAKRDAVSELGSDIYLIIDLRLTP